MPEEMMTNEDNSEGTLEHPFKESCFDLRGKIERLKLEIQRLKLTPVFQGKSAGSPMDTNEMGANLQLAYRHLEDARMRLGKAVQAYDGGTSCYPR